MQARIAAERETATPSPSTRVDPRDPIAREREAAQARLIKRHAAQMARDAPVMSRREAARKAVLDAEYERRQKAAERYVLNRKLVASGQAPLDDRALPRSKPPDARARHKLEARYDARCEPDTLVSARDPSHPLHASYMASRAAWVLAKMAEAERRALRERERRAEKANQKRRTTRRRRPTMDPGARLAEARAELDRMNTAHRRVIAQVREAERCGRITRGDAERAIKRERIAWSRSECLRARLRSRVSNLTRQIARDATLQSGDQNA
jgi:hypothetical protein